MKIKSILVEGQGWFHGEKQIDNLEKGTYHMVQTPITEITKNGEMAPIIWYRQGDNEFNSKYVIQVVYYPGK